MESESRIYSLIGRVLSGDANQQDHQRLQQWLDESKENRVTYERVRQVWDNTQEKAAYSNTERVYRKFLQKRDSISVSEETQPKPIYIKIAQLAASFLVVAIGLYWIVTTSLNATDPSEIALTDSTVVKENPAGQKLKILLSDGSIVWLNSESKLSYPATFSDTTRQLQLVGEAYFQVAKDSKRPFVVTSGILQTTALGTAFNVKHFPGDSSSVVFLTEGKVKIARINEPDSAVLLEPGWGVNLIAERQQLQKFADNATKWAGWKEGILYFENAPLAEITSTCQRWYGVKFNVQGTPTQDWTFTGKFTNESLENVLKSMQYGTDFDFAIQNKQVELTFKSESL